MSTKIAQTSPLASPAITALSQVSLQVDIWIKESDVDAFFASYKPVFDAVTREPELLYFEVFQDPNDPGHLSWVENWAASVEWLFTKQLPKEYYKDYLAKTEPMFVRPREVRILKRFGGDLIVQKERNLAKVE